MRYFDLKSLVVRHLGYLWICTIRHTIPVVTSPRHCQSGEKLIKDGGQFVDLGENISRSKTDIKILQ